MRARRGRRVCGCEGLQRALNGRGLQGGEWLTSFEGPAVFVEPIDPTRLEPGVNELHVCIPAEAEGQVQLRDLRLVGELESGANLITSVVQGSLEDPSDASAAVDGSPAAVAVNSLRGWSYPGI